MADTTLSVQIRALVDGLKNVQGLTEEVNRLAQAAGVPLADPTQPLDQGSRHTASSVGELMAELSRLASLASVLEFLKASVDALRESERSFKGLESASAHAGISIRESFGAATQLAADGLVTVGEASTALQNLLARGYSLDQAIQTLTRLKDAAAFNRQAHLSMGEAVVSASEGIKNENSVLVDNAGVTKNVAKMWEDYAKKLGVTTESLTQQQKVQAEYNGIMEETQAQVGNAEKAADGLEGGFARLSSESKKLLTTFGGDLEPAVMLLGAGLMHLVEFGKATGFMFNAVGIEAGALTVSIGDILHAISSMSFEGLGKKLQANLQQADEQLQEVASRYSQGLPQAIQQTIAKTDEATKAQERQNKASADARAADKDREEGLKQANVQAELAAKLADAQAKAVAEVNKAREAGLAAQIAAARATATEAEQVGHHTVAIEAERQALQKQGELKALQIANARAAVESANAQVEAANRLVEAARKQAEADGAVTDKEKLAIATAQADAEAKRGQAEAARLHLAELTRLPESLRAVTNAQALQNAEVRSLYNAADAAIKNLGLLRQEHAAGKAGADQVAVAERDAAVAVDMLKTASADAAAKVGVLNEAQHQAAISAKAAAITEGEYAQAAAARAASQRQANAAAHADAQRRAEDDAATIHDGEQVAVMLDFISAKMFEYGDAGRKARDEIARLTSTWDQYIHAGGVWLEQAQAQERQVAELIKRLQEGDLSIVALSDNTLQAAASFDKLGEQQLAPLQAALDAARQKLAALNSEAQNTLESLKNDMYQLEGDVQASENLRYKKQMEDLQAKLDAAQKAGSDKAIEALRESMDLAERFHAKKMDNIVKEQQAQAEEKRQQDQLKQEQQKLKQQTRLGQPASQQAAAQPSPAQAARIMEPERVIPLAILTRAGTIRATASANQAALIDALISDLKNQAKTT